MLSKYLTKRCEEYTKENSNTNLDFFGFAEYLWKQGYKENTIRQYLSRLNIWGRDVNEQTIQNFNQEIDSVYSEYITNFKSYTNKKNWIPRLYCKNSVQIKRYRQRFIYSTYLTLLHYLKFINNYKLYNYLSSKITRPKQASVVVKHSYLASDEFKQFIAQIQDMQYQVLFYFLFYSGARISETLLMKKNSSWFGNYAKKNQKLYFDKTRPLKITVPLGIAKTDMQQNLYIDNSHAIELLEQWLNLHVKHDAYVFDFIKPLLPPKVHNKKYNSKNNKNYKDYIYIMKEITQIRKVIRHGLINAGFPHQRVSEINIHSFRRSMMWDNFYKYDKDIRFVQKRARHKNINITSLYLDIDSRLLEKRIEKQMKSELQKN